MPSGVFIISCITTPEFWSRFCSLLFSAKSGAVAIRPKHTTRIDLRIIADLHDQNCVSGDFFPPKHLPVRVLSGTDGRGAIAIPYVGPVDGWISVWFSTPSHHGSWVRG